jgi:hypothetical protein
MTTITLKAIRRDPAGVPEYRRRILEYDRCTRLRCREAARLSITNLMVVVVSVAITIVQAFSIPVDT